MVKKLSILCLSILFCGSVAWAADSAGNRKDSIIMLGMAPAGIHLATLAAPPIRVAVILGDITVGVDAGSTSDSSQTSGSAKSGSYTYTNQGLNARYFFGNSFNASLGYHMRNYSSVSNGNVNNININLYVWIEVALRQEIHRQKRSPWTPRHTVATLGIGNHWLLDWGLWIGGDWVLASGALSQSSEATSLLQFQWNNLGDPVGAV